MFNINIDNTDGYDSTMSYVTPSLYSFVTETYAQLRELCTVDGQSVILSEDIATGLDRLPNLFDFIKSMHELSDAEYVEYIKNTVDNYATAFSALASGVAAVANKYRTFLTAMSVAKDFFNDAIVTGYDIDRLDRNYIVQSDE